MSHTDFSSDARTDQGRLAVDSIRIALGLGGLVTLVLGVLVLINPIKSGVVMMQIVAIIAAIYMVATGVIYLGSAVFSNTMRGWPRVGNALLGVLYVIAGVILFSNIAASGLALVGFITILLGIMWLAEGVLTFTTIRHSGHRLLSVFYGILSILAGVTLIVAPMLAAITLWLLLGASMVVLGVVQMVRAFTVRV